MSLLLNCQSLDKSFGSQRLFKGLSLSVFAGDRLGLIGPNGAGKSTLLQILAGLELADAGILSPKKDLRIGYVTQSNTFPDLTPLEILKGALETTLPDYEKERMAQTWLTKLGFKGSETSAAQLSGGWKKRLAIANALLNQPDLLLLDEPTNHLDLEGVLWLEKFLHRESPTLIFVSHDRTFLQNMATRIIEIDRIYPEGLFSIEGSFENFLEKKRAFIEGQMEQERSVASKARRETEWLRSSPKARTTKAQSRIDNARDVLNEHAELQKRNTLKKVDLSFEATDRETRKLLVAKNLSFDVDGRTLFRHLDFTLLRGTRLGLIGANGSGKTTLLRLLSGELNPHQGTIKRADGLKIAYFDQHRAQLPSEMTLKEALSPLGDFVSFQGRSIHVNGWCKRFLFSPDSLGMPIGKLSGGERARVAIAHLMLQPADLLLLDEPANDLDISTLQMLEENLLEFSGAVVLITHDRSMLEGICNLFLALGDQENGELYASFSQWERVRENQPQTASKAKDERKKSPSEKKKLSYKDKLEYEQIEGKIAQEEERLKSLNALISSPEMMQNSEKLKEACELVAKCEENIHQLYERFAKLDDLQKKH